jgi:hypothetical protein
MESGRSIEQAELMEVAGEEIFVRVRAEVELSAALEGPRRAVYRPNHNFFPADHRALEVGEIELPAEVELRPGEPLEVTVKFLVTPRIAELLTPGRTWGIHEGPRVVGTGTVIRMLSPEQ